MSSALKIGVLIVNLGTPLGTDFFNMRCYLAQFLKDKRIIETSKWLWYPILYGIILNTRPSSAGKKYKRIWNHNKNESPLRTYTRSQCQKLNQTFKSDNIIVEWAMRYGTPSIEHGIHALLEQKCEKILLFPLYPQYSATTTASVYDNFFDVLKTKRIIPPFGTIPSYADNPLYINALAQSIQQHFQNITYKPQHLMVAFHGIPVRYIEKGDPYLKECQKTFKALEEKLDDPSLKMSLTFQSRFGPQEWLQPYTDMRVKALAQEGVQSLAIINPGFASDCLETVDEIGHEVAEIFYENGGQKFSHIPCLNDSDLAIILYRNLILKAL